LATAGTKKTVPALAAEIRIYFKLVEFINITEEF
jgi:hypothetical protein